jgi:hypothetical protein
MSSYESRQRSGRWDDEDGFSRRGTNRRPDPLTPPSRGFREPWDDADDQMDEPYRYRQSDPSDRWEDLTEGARYRLPRGDMTRLWSPALGARRRAWAWRVPGPYMARAFRGRW